MEIRKSRMPDLDTIMAVYDTARAFMRAHGNTEQWVNGYPQRELIVSDIAQGNSFVIEEAGRIVGVYAFIQGDDPAYAVIDGRWRSSAPYGTIHRIASDGSMKGITKACFDHCLQQTEYLRIDTHRDNFIMQKAVMKYGFVYCGVVVIEDGTQRVAFDCLSEAHV